MLHTETVDPSTLDLLKRLQRLPELSNIRLVGGAALALHLGPRRSVYLDLFGNFDSIVPYFLPEMLDGDLTWENVKKTVIAATRKYVLT